MFGPHRIFADDSWYCGRLSGCTRAGQRPHQRRVREIMLELGCVPEQTFATNLVFVDSRTVDELNVDKWRDPCWRVHQRLLRVVSPEYIVCLGNGEGRSAFSALRQGATAVTNERRSKVGRFKGFDATFDLGQGQKLKRTVLGAPHPSWPMTADGLRRFAGL
jgi:uracil-DNA glycosylase